MCIQCVPTASVGGEGEPATNISQAGAWPRQEGAGRGIEWGRGGDACTRARNCCGLLVKRLTVRMYKDQGGHGPAHFLLLMVLWTG